MKNYIGHCNQFQNIEQTKKEPSNKIKYIDSDIGRAVGFNRIAIHHIIIPPHCRSSYPHAESQEEEFVLVLKGVPHLWLNGFIHDLKVGHAIGFPSGTGIAHTFINNTNEEVHLLVAGEKTKKDNLCSFPINLELKESCGIWWDDYPKLKLGSHNGLPGAVEDKHRTNVDPNCILFCPNVKRGKPFHYPGDNESFGEGFRITDHIGLKKLGIWYEYLPVGKRSAFPHAHTHEEEFVYILNGKAQVWLNGQVKEINQDDFAAFPSNTALSHTIINDSDEEVIYLCIGETEDFKDEKIIYPLNPLRNRECERKAWLWKNAPVLKGVEHNGKPKNPAKGHISFHLCDESDWQEVLKIYNNSSSYFLKVGGSIASKKIAKHNIVDSPKETNELYFKEFLIVKKDNLAIGVIDLHAHHPEAGCCYLGLLIIEEKYFGKGLGTKIYQLTEDYIKRSFECKTIRIGISNDNDVSGFWLKMGFKPNEKNYEWKSEYKTTMVQEFEKQI